MVEIKFDDVVLNIPSEWKDIKVADYERWYMKEPSTDMEYAEYVSDVCNIKIDDLLNYPLPVFNKIVSCLVFLKDREPEHSNIINIDNTEYVVSFSNKLLFGEFIDIETTLASESPTRISEVLAILCRPKGEVYKYDADLVDKRKAIFRELTCDKVLPLLAFFLAKRKVLEEILNLYSTAVGQVNLLQKDIESFVRNGDGIKYLTIWQRVKFYFMTRFLKKTQEKFSDISYIKLTKAGQMKTNITF